MRLFLSSFWLVMIVISLHVFAKAFCWEWWLVVLFVWWRVIIYLAPYHDSRGCRGLWLFVAIDNRFWRSCQKDLLSSYRLIRSNDLKCILEGSLVAQLLAQDLPLKNLRLLKCRQRRYLRILLRILLLLLILLLWQNAVHTCRMLFLHFLSPTFFKWENFKIKIN